MKHSQLLLLVGTAIIFATDMSLAYAQQPYAQQEQILPTDRDLKAAYCIKVKQNQIAEASSMYADWAKLAESKGDEDTKKQAARYMQVTKESIDQEKDRLNRLQLYLLPRLKFIESNGAFLAAMSRAKKDLNDAASSEISSCIRQCGTSKRSETDFKACLTACAPETFPRLWSCNDLSWLPF